MIPAWPLLALLWVLAGIGLVASLWPLLVALWWSALGLLLFIVITDVLLALRPLVLTLSRDLPGSLPLGVKRQVGLRLQNHGPRKLQLRVYDHFPNGVSARGLPQAVILVPGAEALLHYSLVPRQRGALEFTGTQVRIASPLKLWWRDRLLENRSSVRVYPNFSAVSKYLLLSGEQHLSLMGIRKRRRRGEGQDFHQLREYREGDSLRQIDWKTTARMRKLISRAYQDERDQTIVLLIDCGRRMLAQDGALSHFDHSLNAMLLLSYVALRQGDAVGLTTFSGEPRWLPPAKGVAAVNRILNTVYDLYPSPMIPDYAQAATQLLAHQRKHALIIVITNLRDEDSFDLIPALGALTKRHLVLLASMQEQSINKVLSSEIGDFDDALRLAATHDYLRHRQRTLEQIRGTGIMSLDCAPSDLSVSLVNRYLQIKRSGVL